MDPGCRGPLKQEQGRPCWGLESANGLPALLTGERKDRGRTGSPPACFSKLTTWSLCQETEQ